MFEFVDGIAGHGKRGHAIQAIFGVPGFGRESGELKFEGKTGACGSGEVGDIGVDAFGKGGEDRARIGCIAFVFGAHVSAVAQGAGVEVAGKRGGSKNFGESSLAGAFPEFHLEEAILGGNDSLSKEEIVLVLGVDVRDTPTVAQDIDGLVEAAELKLSGKDRQGGRGGGWPGGLRGGLSG